MVREWNNSAVLSKEETPFTHRVPQCSVTPATNLQYNGRRWIQGTRTRTTVLRNPIRSLDSGNRVMVDINSQHLREHLQHWGHINDLFLNPESLWSVRSEGLHFLNEYKLWHSLSSCKTFLNLAILSEVQQNRADVEWWFTMNLISSLLSALMFIFLSIIIARLR